MKERTMMASRFKAECLAVLDQVAEAKTSLVITKHGRPIARVVPIDAPRIFDDLRGSVTLLEPDDAAYFGTGEVWDAERPGS